MPEQLGFETMLIIDPWGMAFHAVGVIGLTFDFLFKMVSSYCAMVFTSGDSLEYTRNVNDGNMQATFSLKLALEC